MHAIANGEPVQESNYKGHEQEKTFAKRKSREQDEAKGDTDARDRRAERDTEQSLIPVHPAEFDQAGADG